MTKRIARTIFAVASAAFAACFVLMFFLLCRHAASEKEAELRGIASRIAWGVTEEGAEFLASPLAAVPGGAAELVSPDGEILAAGGAVSSPRGLISVLHGLPDGTSVRVSAPRPDASVILLSILTPGLGLLLLVLLFSGWLASVMSKKIVAPLNELDPEAPDIRGSYPEIAPMMGKIRRQNELIAKQLADQSRRQEEFRAITENMEEGFILVDHKTEVLSYNSGAVRLLGRAPQDCGDVFAAEKLPVYRAAVGEALTGVHNEHTLEVDGRICQLIANPVTVNGKTDGAVVVILDVTAKRQSEQMRREFTSNVSHELKTPLTSIYGISDMICGGMVRAEDIPRFAETIRHESGRMIAVVEDTIRLSQLDEEVVPYEREDVELYALAADVIARLHPEAARRQITLSLDGERRTVNGVASILTEMITNLCENAVKYNRDGGSVRVFVGEENGRTVLSVADTGIGIPKEHHERVFERFYRVDKSHSRDIGGTGLGLSIVKHGAAYHGAEVKLESEVGVGTTVRVLF